MVCALRFALLAGCACTVPAVAREPATADLPAKIAPTGGEVVNHADLAWRLTVGEGWSWRPATQRAKPILLIYSPGVPDESALGGVPEALDTAVCTVTTKAEPDTAGKTQEELNAAVRARFEETKDSVKGTDEDHPLKPLIQGGTVADKKGIAVVTGGYLPIGGDEEKLALAGGASFRTPGFDHRALCMILLDVTKPDYVNTLALTGVQALLATFEPL